MSDQPLTIRKLELDKIPAELREQRRWVLWRYETRDDKFNQGALPGKRRKRQNQTTRQPGPPLTQLPPKLDMVMMALE